MLLLEEVQKLNVVHNETSTGTMVNYLDKVSDLTSRNDSMYIVDSVSLLGGTSLPVDKWNIDVCMTGAQKAIAAPPGISPISISPKAKKYMIANPPATMYFNLARYFKYYEESKHTPFTAAFEVFNDAVKAKEYVNQIEYNVVIKADGLAAGKGVIVCDSKAEAEKSIDMMLVDKKFGDAGNNIIIEERIDGIEASYIALSDGKIAIPMATSQDHKRIFDNDKGPNTGGMGAYSPTTVIHKK